MQKTCHWQLFCIRWYIKSGGLSLRFTCDLYLLLLFSHSNLIKQFNNFFCRILFLFSIGKN